MRQSLGASACIISSVSSCIPNYKQFSQPLTSGMLQIGIVAFPSTWTTKPCLFKTVDEFLLDRDLSNLINDSKIPTPRRFIAQVISFYRCFLKILLTSELATSSFSRGLSSFDEAVVLGGSEVHYVDSIQHLCGYFVQQKWIAPHTKPVVVSEYCSLITKLRSDKICNNKERVSFFSCHYELQSLQTTTCETLVSLLLYLLFPCPDSNPMPMSSLPQSGVFSVLSPLFRRLKVYSCPQIRCLVFSICFLMGQDSFSSVNSQSGICCLPAISNALRFAHHWRHIMARALRKRENPGCPLRIKLSPIRVGVPVRLALQANLLRRIICPMCLALWFVD